MPDAPLLEYASLLRKLRRFRFGFLAGFGAAILANVVPYVFTYRADGTDGFEQIGFPMTFREQGGFVYRYTFSVRALLLDVVFCLSAAVVGGAIAVLWKQLMRPFTR